MSTYTEPQLDALREVANIGAGTAGTALSALLSRPVDLEVPTVLAVAFAEAADALGDPETEVTAVIMPVLGALDAIVVLLFAPPAPDTLCALLGVEPETELGLSALLEIGNILGSTYVRSLEAMTGLQLEPGPPQATVDMLGAILGSAVSLVADGADTALLMDSALAVEGEGCALTFLLLPSIGGVSELLARLGMG